MGLDRRQHAAATASAQSRELLAVFGKVGLVLKRWIRSNLPTDEGMTVPRASLLLRLATEGVGIGMRELGELLGQSPRGMTVLVDGLEKEGLVRRVAHANDRRVTLVEITDAGRRLAEKRLGRSQLVTATLFDELTPKERAELLRLMLKLLQSLRTRGIDVSGPDED